MSGATAVAIALGPAFGEGAPKRLEPRRGFRGWIDRAVGEGLSPGALADAHADLEGLSGCLECHTALSATPDEKCIDCHAEIGRRRQGQLGFHGGLRGRCIRCHPEHHGKDANLLGLDPDAFNHDQALFPLRGAHRTVDCEKCHRRASSPTARERFHPIAIRHDTCLACHADPHEAGFVQGRDCSVCHGESSWKSSGLRIRREGEEDTVGFSHTRDTHFTLDGRHVGLTCVQCHTAARARQEKRNAMPPGTGAPRECAGCHDDRHRGALSGGCERCHSARAWKGPESPFDHAKHTQFALDPLHGSLTCEACHRDLRFRAESRQCSRCHGDAALLLSGRFADVESAPDPHQRLECADCHGPTQQSTALLAYEHTCIGCHTEEYGTLLLTWRRLLDRRVVEAESEIRRIALARRRGEESDRSLNLEQIADRVERLARSGPHHPTLAETILRREISRLRASRSTVP